jgi:hypothetical protein
MSIHPQPQLKGAGRCLRAPPPAGAHPDGVMRSFVYTLHRMAHAADTKHAPAMESAPASQDAPIALGH